MQSTNNKLPNVKQTLTSREGNKVVYVTHVGPNRSQRRDVKFRPAMVAVQFDRVLERESTASKRAAVGVAERFVAALRMLGAR